MKIEKLYEIFLKHPKITTDSRKIEEGAIFFALKGENFDGNKYAIKAIEKGCSYAVVDNPKEVKGDRIILVDNVLLALQKLANHHRDVLNLPIIAITGTNGKTTTKELLASVLSRSYKVSYTQGNLNNHIGVPITLLQMDKNTEIGIVEMGANHLGDIRLLCEIAEPNYGVITNIGKAHIEGFGSVENIKKTKKELYDYIQLTKGKIFYNSENPILSELVLDLKLDAISFGGDTEINAKVLSGEQFLRLDAKIKGDSLKINTNLIGSYNAENIIAAMCIGNYFNVNTNEIIAAIEGYIPTNNRSQFIKTSKNSIVLDAYNANPTSVSAALENFEMLNLDNKALILGDMLELGAEAEKEHKHIISLIKDKEFRYIFVVGKVYNSIEKPKEIIAYSCVDDLIEWIKLNKLEGLSFLIKGSRGIRLERVVEFL